MGKMMVCDSCGAEFEENLAKCPYCGSMNVKGAEREYMEKLEDVQEDMEELEDAPLDELSDTVKKQGRFLAKVFLVVLAVVGILVLAYFFIERRDRWDPKAEYAWQQEYYPRLNQLYDEGDYDGMVDLALEAMGEDNAAIWKWEHYDFYEAYSYARDFERAHSQLEKEKLLDSEYVLLFQAEWYLVLLEEKDQVELTDRDREVLRPYIEKAGAALSSEWGMSEEEYRQYWNLAKENYHIMPYENCRDFVERWLKQ